MKIHELIQRLKDCEARYGPETDVVFLDYENGKFINAPVTDVLEISEFGTAYAYEGISSIPLIMIS